MESLIVGGIIGVAAIAFAVANPSIGIDDKGSEFKSTRQKAKDEDEAKYKKYEKYTNLFENSSREDLNAALGKIEDEDYKKGLMSYLQERRLSFSFCPHRT